MLRISKLNFKLFLVAFDNIEINIIGLLTEMHVNWFIDLLRKTSHIIKRLV